MAAFYGTKIKNHEINPKTGSAWVIEDVPKFYRAKTQAWLDENT